MIADHIGAGCDTPTPSRGVGGGQYTREMRIAVGSDHAGFTLKDHVAAHLAVLGHEVVDLGTHDEVTSVDYPDYGAAVGRAVADGQADLGVCVCGTGVGISIAANKIPGIRAALVHDVTTARLARQHNDANVVCLGGRTTGVATATDSIEAFLSSEFGAGRHIKRIDKIAALDEARGERRD
jgi:ribose 5-phosphate isomerase B